MNQFKEQNTGKSKRMSYNALGTIGVILAAFLVGNVSARFGIFVGPDASEYSKAVKYAQDYSNYAGLFEARQALIDNYNGDVEDDVLLDGAIKGMTASLKDPYTLYMTKDEYKKFNLSNSGLRIGIGVTIFAKDNTVTIVNVEADKPAAKANLTSGDIIVKVDGEDIGGDVSKAISLISDTSKKTTKLTILRSGNNTFDAELTKEEIKTDSVSGEIIENKVGYIRLKDFNEDASKSFIDKLKELKDKGAAGLILDLRGNGGGFLTEAESIASQFIPESKVITTLNNKFGKEKKILSKGGIAQEMPMVLLIDGNTASASEVLTGALRDYGIATTVGTNTYGKGVAQAPFTLENTEGALKITIDNFYTPNGENIHKIGIKPDYEVKLSETDTNKEYSRNTDPQFQKGLEVIREKIK
ncbi:S41 family peptidase [Clostridium sp. SHJSY1]|uniref:S41 family peptidase n=1 Tax=Clostridium sp. SHJSY1 TaxID=2942483 RepID=UPI002876AA1B|nr:S41 family peptidase [Clostridium sp. SHJSY1]MDS0526222.1 S41 family peptidase [Clostridium sp. SHJSY1]